MTAQAEKTLVIPLTDGVVEGVLDESAQGAMLISNNTRLTASKGTLQRRPGWTELEQSPTGQPLCGGIVNGAGDSMCAYFKPHTGQRRIVNEDIERLRAAPYRSLYTRDQNAYFPYQLTDSGQAFTCQSMQPACVAIDASGNTWMLVRGAVSYTQPALYVKVYSPSGELLVSEREIRLTSADHPDFGEGAGTYDFPEYLYAWCGLTASTTGMTAWYEDVGVVYALSLQLDGLGGVLVASGPHTIFTLWFNEAGIRQCDVVSDGGDYAYLLAPTTSTDTTLYRVNQSTFVATSSTLASTHSGYADVSLSYVTISGNPRLYAGIASVTTSIVRRFTPSTLAQVWTQSINYGTFEGVGLVQVLPWVQGGLDRVLVAAMAAETSTVASPALCTVTLDAATGSPDQSGEFWHRGLFRGFYHRVSDTEIYPYLLTQHLFSYNAVSEAPGFDELTVTDPALEIVAPQYSGASLQTSLTMIARVGVDNSTTMRALVSAPCACSGSVAVVSYVEAKSRIASNAAINTTRWAKLDMAPTHQPSTAMDEGGSSTIAAAMPVVWDGQETVDISIPHRPLILVEADGGTGPALPAGTYSFTAVVSWRDASGNLRRSAPSLPKVVTDPGAPSVLVSTDKYFRNGQNQIFVECTLYTTLVNGSIFYANSVSSFNTSRWFEFSSVAEPSASNEQLYSTGTNNEPLLPWAPGALWDVETIGTRQWAIDAEHRNRLLPSKLKESGIAFEYAPELQIFTDHQRGKLMKIVDIGGQVRVLAERGVWAISGYGPDNSGFGGAFGDPQLIATFGCYARHTVAVIPSVGVIFQCHDKKLAMLGGGGLKRFETIADYDLESPSIYPVECEVVWPISGSAGMLVYNWLADAWTHWESTGHIATGAKCDVDAGENVRTYAWDASASEFVVMDSDSIDSTGLIELERGWIAPEGGDSDVVMRELWLRLHYMSEASHNLFIRVDFDYGQGPAHVLRSWTASELNTLRRGDRVTVGVNLQGTRCRAFKVQISDSGTDYMRPIGCELTYGVSGGQQRKALRAGALK